MMKRLTRLIGSGLSVFLLIGVLGWSLSPLAAQQTGQDTITQIDNFIQQLTADGLFSGAVLVARGDDILLSKGYGMANLDWDISNTPETKFRIASLTKQFTAMSILMLQQQGKLSIQDSICAYLEDCPEAWAEITFEQLMSHSSGFSRGQSLLPQLLPPARRVRTFKGEPLIYAPGEGWAYSNTGYVILGYLIQEISGQTYQRYLRENILDPLGLDNTGYDDPYQVLKQRAVGYASATEIAPINFGYADSGLYSTVGDLYLWIRALMNGRLIPQETLDAMWAASVIPSVDYGRDMRYAYGLVSRQFNKHWVVGHDGGDTGFSSRLSFFPDDDVSIIVLSNLASAPSWQIADSIAQDIFAQGSP